MKAHRTRTSQDHPALASAKRAIRSGLAHLTPAHVFQLAATVDTMRYGEDQGRWSASASYATDHPAPMRWRCDEPKVTKWTKGGA